MNEYVDQHHKSVALLNHQAYKAEFILTPAPSPFNPETRYNHLTKDFSSTNLRQNNTKKDVDDPTEMTYLLKGFHPMTNPKHFKVIKNIQIIPTEEYRDYIYKVLDEEGKEKEIVIKRQVFIEKEVETKITQFPKSFHLYESNINTKIMVCGATNGHLAKLSVTDRSEKEESVQDKTEIKPKGIFSMGGGKQQ